MVIIETNMYERGGGKMAISLTKESVEQVFANYLEKIFCKPEIASATVRDIVINRDNFRKATKEAFDAGYHDCYSDIDLSCNIL